MTINGSLINLVLINVPCKSCIVEKGHLETGGLSDY